jgi:chromosome segregation ATPase
MDRVHVPFDGPTLARIDREREKTGTSRAQWLSSAVVQYLAQLDQFKGQDPANLVQELTQQKIEYEKLWKENQRLDRAEKAAREDVDQGRREIGPLKDQNAAITTELEQARFDMALLKRDMDHARDTIGSRDKQIAFLEAHIANLVQSIGQLAIKPSEEEAKKKGWSWKFWK